MAVERSAKMGSKYKMVYSDHYTCLLTLSDLPRMKETRQPKQTVWTLKKEGGWKTYQELTENYSQALEKMLEKDDTIDNKMKKFNKIHEKIKYAAFGKVTIGAKDRNTKSTIKDDKNKDAKELYEEKARRVEQEIEEIRNLKKSRVGKIWDIRKKIIGGKKKKNEISAIVDPENRKVVASRNKI